MTKPDRPSTPAYAPHTAFAAPALASNQIGKLITGILAVELLFALGLIMLGNALEGLSPGFAYTYVSGTTPIGLILQLLSFALLIVSIGFVLKRHHNRHLLTTLGDPIAAIQTLVAVFLGVAMLHLALEILPPWWDTAAISEKRHLIAWALTVPFGLFALLIQTSAEEVFYRGYIQQQVAARFSNPVIWMVAPNLLFAFAHWDNGVTTVDRWQYVIWAFFFGLAASDLTARTGNLGAAIGLHLANNAFAFMLYGEIGGNDSGLALFLLPEMTGQPGGGGQSGPVLTMGLFIDLVVVWMSWLAARIAIRR
ncbi:MAG: lysostaphin resistance A-like protein [Pseudooceanicola sp.]